MSQENVELSQAWNEAWNAGDMDAVRELYDPDVVVRPMKDWPEPGPFLRSRGGHAMVGADSRYLGHLGGRDGQPGRRGRPHHRKAHPLRQGPGASLWGRILDGHDGSKGQ